MSERSKGIISLFLLVFVWGLLAVIPKYLSSVMPVMQHLYIRLFLGFIFSLIFFKKRLRPKIVFSSTKNAWALIILRSLLYYIGGAVFFNYALTLAKVGSISFIGALPFTALLGFIVYKEKFTWSKAALIALSFIGVLVISLKESVSLTFGRGEVLALISSVFLAVALTMRKWQKDDMNDREISTLMLFFAAISICALSLFNGDGLPNFEWSAVTYIALIVGSLLVAAMSFLMNYGFARVDAVMSGNILTFDPVSASLMAFFAFGEVLSIRELLGGGLILVSVLLLNKLEKSHA